jgi:tetratricopeptide (TPR) repeat protein
MPGDQVRKDIAQRLRKGDISGAIRGYLQLIEHAPDDWTSINALGDLYLKQGDDESAIIHFSRVAEHYSAEGFLPRAAALYRKILKVRHDDYALLSLIDVVARQGRLTEARDYLVELEQRRRANGDLEGADDCLNSLERLAEVQANGPAMINDVEGSPPVGDAPPPIAEPEPPNVAAAATTVETPAEPFAAPESLREDPLPEVSSPTPAARTTEVPRRRKPGGTARKGTGARRAKPLQAVFDQMRGAAEKEQDTAQEHFDLAQYYLRDGRENDAIVQLELAAQAPIIRFKASAQLGRLYLWRGDRVAAIQWLERAAEAPPVSPDEGHAVLYELAEALEQAGELARALAVLLDLDAQRRGYRDTARRIDRLSETIESGGGGQ